MPTVDRLRQLIQMVEEGRLLDAYREFYTDDTVGQDNLEPERVGLEANVARQAAALKMVAEAHENRAVSFIADGDRSAIEWFFDLTDLEGNRRQLREIAWQTWRGDRISHEHFYYDSKQM